MRIYSCKLYRSSKHKDRIKAALNDPINAELVTQLTSYLDDPKAVKTELDRIKEKKVAKPAVKRDVSAPSPGSRFSSGSPSSPDSTLSDLLDEPETEETEELDESVLESSTKIQSSHDACGEIGTDSLLGSLNMDADTQGVVRVIVRPDSECNTEVWIHYNDKVNLNNIMEKVISKVHDLGYPLEFNRLARSDNAVVFQKITELSSVNG